MISEILDLMEWREKVMLINDVEYISKCTQSKVVWLTGECAKMTKLQNTHAAHKIEETATQKNIRQDV